MQQAKFNLHSQQEFLKTLKTRVNDYFQDSGISKFGNRFLYWKTVIMFILYATPFVVILTGIVPFWANWILYLIMGLGTVGIGMSVMHDANHGSYAKNKTLNRIISHSMELIGGSSFNWKVQHNVLHHTYTNIPGMDEDIADKTIIRLEPTASWKKIHRFQHIYALPLYALMTFSWILWGDFTTLISYNKRGLTKQVGGKGTRELTVLAFSKLIYLFMHFVLPIFILGFVWWHILIGFLLMHLIAGFILAIVFQLAHIVEETDYPEPDAEGNLENNWAVHQLHTTANFAKRRKLLSWFIGGLNYQIEHHLFPNISHVHYPKIAKIVKATAAEFKLPYHEFRTFRSAILSHLRQLKELGRKPALG